MFIDKSADKQKEHFKYGINHWTGEPNKPVFYTEEMKKAVHQIKKPPMLLMDIVMYPGDFLALRLYEDNFLQFEGTQKEIVIDYVMKVKKLIESYGVRCEMEGKPSEKVL
jgi:predicted YcjX-like family ATPase